MSDEPPESIRDMIRRKKREAQDRGGGDKLPMYLLANDPFMNANTATYLSRRPSGITFDTILLQHKCEWDEFYPENPTRLELPLARLNTMGYLTKCLQVYNEVRTDLKMRILKVHTEDHYKQLEEVCDMIDNHILEQEASNYDAIYFNEATYECAMRALSSVLNMIEAVSRGDAQNGFALVRPPGHHAMKEKFCGYCYFNNVAIGAEMILSEGWGKRVLIIDYDVHHGQATQQMFYDRNDVLYFSIHRYEQGTFWPNLRESNYNYIGRSEGLGYNINVPLNEIGLSDQDYLAIVFHVLLPVAYEYNPDYILISGGYDACMGCPEGLMDVTPGFYANLIRMLGGLAKGRIVVALEGGYFVPTLTEGIVQTIKALYGDPCPMLNPIGHAHPSVIESICNVKRTLLPFWNCFKLCELAMPMSAPSPEHAFEVMYLGEEPKPPYPTKDCYPTNSKERSMEVEHYLETLQTRYNRTELPVFFAFEDDMLLHKPKFGEVERPERPERIEAIIKQFHEYGVYDRMIRCRINQRDITPYLVHDINYVTQVHASLLQPCNDVYQNEHSARAASLAVSTLLTLTDTIFQSKCNIALGIIRPPGHHAEYDNAMGFCLFNNVASAAKYALEVYNLEKILIIDFDIHHGNGTQNAFYDSKNVMYISIHRHEDGKFFPSNQPSYYTNDGHGLGKGYNINIPFSGDKMGDSEYMLAFQSIVLPLAYAYAPEFLIVSAGFDAGIHDPLGGYHVSPETFGQFIQLLKPLAYGRMLIALEGGYNLTTTAYSMGLCAKAALNDPIPLPSGLFTDTSPKAIERIQSVIEHLKLYWPVLHTWKKLSSYPQLVKKTENITFQDHLRGITKPLNIDKIYDTDYIEEQLDNM